MHLITYPPLQRSIEGANSLHQQVQLKILKETIAKISSAPKFQTPRGDRTSKHRIPKFQSCCVLGSKENFSAWDRASGYTKDIICKETKVLTPQRQSSSVKQALL